ncbi:MAG TPA: DUF202 domain-containing protein [Puia sp.]|nr:DUF202 domain-containing protein [Puia sp.]
MAGEKLKTTSDHLANERTFLAWIRTSVGIMAFGFVVSVLLIGYLMENI